MTRLLIWWLSTKTTFAESGGTKCDCPGLKYVSGGTDKHRVITDLLLGSLRLWISIYFQIFIQMLPSSLPLPRSLRHPPVTLNPPPPIQHPSFQVTVRFPSSVSVCRLPFTLSIFSSIRQHSKHCQFVLFFHLFFFRFFFRQLIFFLLPAPPLIYFYPVNLLVSHHSNSLFSFPFSFSFFRNPPPPRLPPFHPHPSPFPTPSSRLQKIKKLFIKR